MRITSNDLRRLIREEVNEASKKPNGRVGRKKPERIERRSLDDFDSYAAAQGADELDKAALAVERFGLMLKPYQSNKKIKSLMESMLSARDELYNIKDVWSELILGEGDAVSSMTTRISRRNA